MCSHRVSPYSRECIYCGEKETNIVSYPEVNNPPLEIILHPLFALYYRDRPHEYRAYSYPTDA